MLLVSVLSIIFFRFNLGLDFLGGARWALSFDEATVTAEQMTDFFATQGNLTKEAQVQATSEGFLVTVESLPDAEITTLKENLRTSLGEYTESAYQNVDAAIGQRFQYKSLTAIAMALVVIVAFVAWAFRSIPESINPLRFGGVAIIALAHDVLIIMGVFAILGYFFDVELGLTFITALLATLGFSVNDTIVILDRVRENIHTQKASETFEDTIEKSVQQTLRRSINTSISTLLPLFALLIFGAPSIFYFVLALIIGIAVGTYSSIFLAAPLLVSWKDWADARA